MLPQRAKDMRNRCHQFYYTLAGIKVLLAPNWDFLAAIRKDGEIFKRQWLFHRVLWCSLMPSHVPTRISCTTNGTICCLGNTCKWKMLDWGDLGSSLGSVALRPWRWLNLKLPLLWLFFSFMDCYAIGSWKTYYKDVWTACLNDVFLPKHETLRGFEQKLCLH